MQKGEYLIVWGSKVSGGSHDHSWMKPNTLQRWGDPEQASYEEQAGNSDKQRQNAITEAKTGASRKGESCRSPCVGL